MKSISNKQQLFLILHKHFKNCKLTPQLLFVPLSVSQMDRQIVDPDPKLQRGDLDWRPALRNSKTGTSYSQWNGTWHSPGYYDTIAEMGF